MALLLDYLPAHREPGSLQHVQASMIIFYGSALHRVAWSVLIPLRSALVLLLAMALLSSPASPATIDDESEQTIGEFLLLLLGNPEGKREAAAYVEANWQAGFTPMLVEVLTFNRDVSFSAELVSLLERKTGQDFGYDIDRWLVWQWNQASQPYRHYTDFKRALYGLIDERFEAYFDTTGTAEIRLDEVIWGGVEQDGIPPLRNPDMVAAAEATYLGDADIVFGLAINGDIRAYPQRILGWHEMFVDEVGGVSVAGVYCTLCGTMILYNTSVAGVKHELGTSGFLYRSNKLMYDRATQSLWNTIWGRPVIGSLAGQGITLERMSVVTTTWGEWRRRHPATRVLSLGTGYVRDYSEGAAYRDYYATDALMFQVPGQDSRLNNKAEVLGLILPRYPDQPLAISADFLALNPVYEETIGATTIVILTDASGANRVYQSAETRFVGWDGDELAVDSTGVEWRLSESGLTAPDGRILYRLPAHRAFWFGWFSAYNHTRLVQ